MPSTRFTKESLDLGFKSSILALIFALLPSILKVPLYRLSGANIGKKVSIGFGSVILGDSFSKVSIGDYSQIRSFTLIICSEVYIGKYTEIAMFVWIWGAGKLNIGNKCYIGPRCVINLRRNNFKMGEYAGLGPSSIVYTHGQWLPYTQGWPRKYGDVVLEDYAWVPARVFLAPGVKVGMKSIIGSGSVITKDIPANSFAAGMPAKVISPIEKVIEPVDKEELFNRAIEIAEDLPDFFGFKVLSKHDYEGIMMIQLERRKLLQKHIFNIIVLKPEYTNKLIEYKVDLNKTILLLVDRLPKDFQSRVYLWFNLKDLQCNNINESFAYDIWNFLRRTWCVTCDVIEY